MLVRMTKPCPACSHPVATDATTCLHCGKQVRFGAFAWFGIAIMAGFAIWVFTWFV